MFSLLSWLFYLLLSRFYLLIIYWDRDILFFFINLSIEFSRFVLPIEAGPLKDSRCIIITRSRDIIYFLA